MSSRSAFSPSSSSAARPAAALLVLLATLASGLVGCSRSEKKADPAPVVAAPPEPARSAPPLPEAAAPKKAKVAYAVPTAWREAMAPSPLRLATYKTPRVEGDAEDPELVVSEAGGTVEANVQRWTHQIRSVAPPKVTKREVNGLEVTTVEARGAYSPVRPATVGRPMGAFAKSGYMMLGAVVKSDDGVHTFFKLVGPEKSVAAARPDFEKLVASLAKR